jgi:hypothetical protein
VSRARPGRGALMWSDSKRAALTEGRSQRGTCDSTGAVADRTGACDGGREGVPAGMDAAIVTAVWTSRASVFRRRSATRTRRLPPAAAATSKARIPGVPPAPLGSTPVVPAPPTGVVPAPGTVLGAAVPAGDDVGVGFGVGRGVGRGVGAAVGRGVGVGVGRGVGVGVGVGLGLGEGFPLADGGAAGSISGELLGWGLAVAVATKPAIVQATTSSATASLGSMVPMDRAGRVSPQPSPVSDPSVMPHGPRVRHGHAELAASPAANGAGAQPASLEMTFQYGLVTQAGLATSLQGFGAHRQPHFEELDAAPDSRPPGRLREDRSERGPHSRLVSPPLPKSAVDPAGRMRTCASSAP